MKRRFQIEAWTGQAFFLKEDLRWIESVARALIAHIDLLRKLRHLERAAGPRPPARRRARCCRSARPCLVSAPRRFSSFYWSPLFGGRA